MSDWFPCVIKTIWYSRHVIRGEGDGGVTRKGDETGRPQGRTRRGYNEKIEESWIV